LKEIRRGEIKVTKGGTTEIVDLVNERKISEEICKRTLNL
jgi:hypothetical protein